MKNKIHLLLVLMVVALTSCSKYGYVSLNYPTEPEVIIPENINSIALANRSLTKEEDKKERIIESITSGEIAGADAPASDECLRGVYDNMNGLYGINIVIPEENKLNGSASWVSPEMLPWDQVATLCKQSGVDALLVLETFDSNSDIMLTAATETVNALLSGKIPDPTAPRQVKMNVVCEWRLYDPQNKIVVDKFRHTSYLTFSTHDPIAPFDALPKTAYAAGEEYSFRFLPGYYKVKRKLYSKAKGPGKHNFQVGYRQSEVANWDGAIESWTGFVEVAKPKFAGRACLNIAVGYEVLGNTSEALKWAQRGYTEYDDDLARSYAKTLLRRQSLEQ